MLLFRVGATIICMTSILTSTISERSKTDGHQPSSINEYFAKSPIETKTPATSETATGSSSNHVSNNVSNNEGQPQIYAEGGPFTNISQFEPVSLIKSSTESTDVLGSLPVHKLAVDSQKKIHIQANGTKSSVVARKGVSVDLIPMLQTDEHEGLSNSNKSVPTIEKLQDMQSTLSISKTTMELPAVIPESTTSMIEHTNQTSLLHNTQLEGTIPKNRTSAMVLLIPSQQVNGSPQHKPKSKPTVTIGEGDDDNGVPSRPAQTLMHDMPRKIDYIIPVVITVMVVPLLVVGVFVLYRRGRDCWEKRHYRRMDFLIDGMYND